MSLYQPMHWLGGFIADLPTPFDDGDRVDWTAFETLCEHQIGSGATAIVVGETAPDFSLLDTTGTPRRLSELTKDSSCVVLFYRGHW